MEKYLLDDKQIYKPIKQNVATYLLYLLLTPVTLNTYGTNQDGQTENTSSTPIGLAIGPRITALNTITASSANKKFKTEIETYNLSGKTVKAGESITGLIGFKEDSFYNIKIDVQK